jgi:hypothetical protein
MEARCGEADRGFEVLWLVLLGEGGSQLGQGSRPFTGSLHWGQVGLALGLELGAKGFGTESPALFFSLGWGRAFTGASPRRKLGLTVSALTSLSTSA